MSDKRKDFIFLVEPDPENQNRFEPIFRENGWHLTVAEDARSLPESKDREPSVILVPAGREGFDELDFIRRTRLNPATENTPILVLAERVQYGQSVAALREGADDIASDPFTPERLVPRIKAHICLAHLRREEGGRVPQAIDQIRLSERRFRSLVSATAAIVWIAAEDGRVREELPGWEKFTGQSQEEYRDFGWLSAVHPDDRETVRQLFKGGEPKDDRGEIDADFRLRRQDGEDRHMHLRAIPVANRKDPLREWVGAITDITERRRAEEALRSSEERLRLILESSRDFAIFTTDMEGKVTTWNAGAQQLLGYTDEEICGTDFLRIFIPEDIEAGAPDEEMENALKSGRGADQRWHVRKDGSRFWADGLLMPLRNKKGEAHGYLKIIRDFTDQKKSQDELCKLTEELEKRVEERTKELEDSKSRLRSLVFQLNKTEQLERQRIAAELHDGLAQLLTAGRITLESATRELKEVPSSLKRVQEIVSEATRTTRSMMAELSGPPVLDDDLVVAIRWVVEKMREEGLEIDLTHNEASIPLSRDFLSIMYQSVRELLLNVQKHADVSKASVDVRRSPEKIEIEVADNGGGFDPKKEKAATGGEGGFGLLNMHERLRWLGGMLDIQSAPGRGTRVTVALPLREELVVADQAETTAAPRMARKPGNFEADRINVLLVDDHRMVREGFRTIIEGREDIHVVGEAAHGIEALKIARERHPDIVVMDINMPKMNGLEATRRLLEEMPDVTVIGLSLHGRDDMAEAITKAGASAYISKEEACDTLCDVIREEYYKRHPEQISSE